MGLLQTSVIIGPDTLANQPAANTVPIGALYCITDSSPANLLQRSNGTTWDDYSPSGGGGANAVTAAGTLTANRLVLGAGTKTVAEAASLGTTTTVLHGNAAGAPSFGAVVLTTDVSGVLPVANGGSGTTSTPKVYSAAFSFTNAQIKALPTTYIEVVAAPTINQFLCFHYAAFYIDAAAGAYTNFDTGPLSGFAITYGDWLNDASTFTTGWGGTTQGFYLTTPSTEVNNIAGNFLYPTVGTTVTGNANFKFISWNDPGDFTGGNAANTLKGTLAYSIFDFSTGTFV